MRNRSTSANRRVVLVQQPLKVEGEVEKEGKQEEESKGGVTSGEKSIFRSRKGI